MNSTQTSTKTELSKAEIIDHLSHLEDTYKMVYNSGQNHPVLKFNDRLIDLIARADLNKTLA